MRRALGVARTIPIAVEAGVTMIVALPDHVEA